MVPSHKVYLHLLITTLQHKIKEVHLLCPQFRPLPFQTTSMKQSSWEVNSHLAGQETPYLSQNLKVHYHVHKSLPLVPTLSQMYPVNTFPPHFLKIQSNVILPCMPTFLERSFPLRFSDQTFVCNFISHPCYMFHPSHSPWLDHPNKIWWCVQDMELLIMHLLQPAATSFLLLQIYMPTIFQEEVIPPYFSMKSERCWKPHFQTKGLGCETKLHSCLEALILSHSSLWGWLKTKTNDL